MNHIRELMTARTWDALGNQRPRDWFWVCGTCGAVSMEYLSDQSAAMDSWHRHWSMPGPDDGPQDASGGLSDGTEPDDPQQRT